MSSTERPELKNEVSPPTKEDRMKILENYFGIIKLDKPITLKEILELEDDNWLY